jgi:hypothetical protein
MYRNLKCLIATGYYKTEYWNHEDEVDYGEYSLAGGAQSGDYRGEQRHWV